MLTIHIENIKVTIYTDPNEYAKEFFDIPEGAILDIENLPHSAGFSCIDDNEIFIFKNENCPFEDLLSTVAHELGHLISGGYKKNPPQTKKYDSIHELKANHYENFVMKVYKITTEILNINEKSTIENPWCQ